MHFLTAPGALADSLRSFVKRVRIGSHQRSPTAPSDGPLRGEILSLTQLEAHARAIATDQRDVLLIYRGGDPLRAALDKDEHSIAVAHQSLGKDVRGGVPLSPAGEWLIDNYYVVAEQIRAIRHDLPRGYYRELPKLRYGSLKGLPRVYAIALELITHTDGRIDAETLLRFLNAYQSVTPLQMGELWAVAIMLRIGLVKNLSRLSALTLMARQLRHDANTWAERLLGSEGQDVDEASVLNELAQRYPVLPVTFAAQLLRHLRAHEGDHDIGQVITWLETQPVTPHETIEALIHEEHQRQAANQVSVGNTITSMRTISALDWPDWFERVSPVEQVLRLDPAGAYAQSTFATRDRYRHIIEDLARRSELGEYQVARLLIARAERADNDDPRQRHIGYYLVDHGRSAFERELGYSPPLVERARRVVLDHPTPLYLGAIGGTTAATIAIFNRLARLDRARPHQWSAGASSLLPLTLPPAIALASELVNRAVTRILPPRVLPRLDLSDGIPEELTTVVVVPTLLLTPESVNSQLDRLEVIALANQDRHLHFALLTDFADAPAQEMPEDATLLRVAVERLRRLAEQHGPERFLLLHRGRVWNEQQRCWMGWERKRGKLEEFNALLTGAQDTSYAAMVGDIRVLSRVRYVITLDADTQLPRDVGQSLIGTIAHPLNQARLDPKTGRVVEGYGILQPRVGIDLPSATTSRFARVFSGNIGVDPYTTAVSDAYMDLFGEGIFAGKGIYDPLALQVALTGRFPENALLSHDLIEGLYARAGLLSDVEVVDSYPTTYAAWAARMHRWVRGDWQIAAWLLPYTPARGGWRPNELPLIARYKIFDNLRRSLTPPGTVALLVAGWRWLPGRPTAWTGLALAHLATPLAFDLTGAIISAARAPGNFAALRDQARQLRQSMLRLGLNLAFLPDQAVLNLDAITRTLTRLLITRRNLLEWETADQAQSRLQRSSLPVLRRGAPLVAAGTALSILPGRPYIEALSALPVLIDWLAAPAIAAWLDQPYLTQQRPLSDQDRLLLRKLARATWAYFERFVRPEANFLAPDNFQETPRPVIADRTSPTNIGLQLLTDLAAHDFGYIGILELTARTERVFATIDRLERYLGHLLNWYDTQTLRSLPPAYVSTVDSGNFAGALLALRQGYLTLRDTPVIGTQALSGLEDTLAMLIEADGGQEDRRTGGQGDEGILVDPKHSPPQHDSPPDTPGANAAGNDSASRLPDTPGANAAGNDRGQGGKGTREQEPATRGVAPSLDDRIAQLAALLKSAPETVEGYYDLLCNIEAQAEALDLAGPAAEWAARLAAQARSLQEDLNTLVPSTLWSAAPPTLGELADADSSDAAELIERHARIANTCAEQVAEMDFSFLFDDRRHLFVIGYNLSDGRLDSSYYDLLASESRLGSFLAIARGDAPQEHWFHMGRGLTAVGTRSAMVSWSGTMFEYLMPLILMRRYPETLLDTTYDAAVAGQIAYGKERKVPWGISESAFNARDVAMNYQYRAFGVPGLGLKSGLGEDLVIAPYATMLALSVQPVEAIANLRALITEGMLGAYGLYEAADFTPDRLPPGQRRAIIRSFMAHHQGMSLLSLGNILHNNLMQRRFHAEPIVQATEMLLQERIPNSPPVQTARIAAREPQVMLTSAPLPRQFTTPHTIVPYTHLLSNGGYSVMLTTAGGGMSKVVSRDNPGADLAVTRWRSDITRDGWGSYIYVRDARSGATWATGYHPTRHDLQNYQVTYSLDRAEFRQRVAGIDTRMEVVVSPEENVELRRVTLTNLTSAPRELELTSYAELVLAAISADEAHPAFSNLFVETEFVPEHDALLATRRPRAPTDRRLWAVHSLGVRGHVLGAIQYESDRVAFIGRGHNLSAPHALHRQLDGHTGAVLDPILSLRRRVRIVPGGSAQVTFITGVAESREEALTLADRFRDPGAVARAFELAWTQSQVELRDLGVDADLVHRFQRLASAALYLDGRRRARPETIAANTLGQPALWSHGISGDFPLVLVRVGVGDELTLVGELLRAHEYWRLKRLLVDLVILNEDSGGYAQSRQEQILAMIRGSRGSALLNGRGGIFVLRSDLLSAADQTLLETVACCILSTRRGDLAQHLRSREGDRAQPPQMPKLSNAPDAPLAPLDLILRSDYGGFTTDGREYVIDLAPDQITPAPWTNVIANPDFGFIVTEAGGGYTWAANSRENRLTPWSNDPLRDPPGEALYLRDEASGAFWSPTPQPAGYVRVRHGFGYSTFERRRGEIASSLTMFVPPDDPVKIFRLRLRNHGASRAQLTAAIYVEWVLGVFRAQMAPSIITAYDEQSGALLARNSYNIEFAGRVAFLATSERRLSYTGDRTEFIGRNSSLSRPTALAAHQLSGRVGAGLDPCGALSCPIELAPGEEREIVFLLGQGVDTEEARRIVAHYSDPRVAARAFDETVTRWRAILEQTRVRTPDPSLDVLLNGWLLYQNLVCRIWGRSAFYQSGGAYGFRDQLQDVMALVHTAPELTAAQIRRAAARQFVEGDVQHWWHPPTGRGIRTGFSDDYLWLAYVTQQYIRATGDVGILDTTESFLEGRPLEPGEAEYYDLPTVSQETGTIYEHCVRAIDYGLGRMGPHDLPLMGVGDWNDGMNLVGEGGTGESIWVAWFQISILRPFAALAEQRGDNERAERYRAEAERLRRTIEDVAWDGDWYLRAFYDDGTPLGSRASDECRIDSLAQSWALISGAGDPERARRAMEAVDEQLVDRQAGLIRLFTPAFDKTDHNPGYIKGYVPGVRENGGQYTHAAIWTIWAWTLLGNGTRAAELLRLINPQRHAAEAAERYMVEPYTIAADVYTAEGHTGRGGWTWYTGSAGWLYRLGIEQLLGLRREGNALIVAPCIPPEWLGFTASYRFGATTYTIVVEQGSGEAPEATLDGVALPDARIHLTDDGGTHKVIVALAPGSP